MGCKSVVKILGFFTPSYGHFIGKHPVVCPDCNIEDVMLSNMRGKIAEHDRRDCRKYCICAAFSGLGFEAFRVSGF